MERKHRLEKFCVLFSRINRISIQSICDIRDLKARGRRGILTSPLVSSTELINTDFKITTKPLPELWYFNSSSQWFGPAVRVFANGPGDLGSIPGRVIPKTLKMELDTTLLNIRHYKVQG